jgi:hypothetical protein
MNAMLSAEIRNRYGALSLFPYQRRPIPLLVQDCLLSVCSEREYPVLKNPQEGEIYRLLFIGSSALCSCGVAVLSWEKI